MRTQVLRRPIVFLRVRCSIPHCICTTRFNIKNFYVSPTKCICVFYIDFRTNSDYKSLDFATVQVRSSFFRDVMARTWLVPNVSLSHLQVWTFPGRWDNHSVSKGQAQTKHIPNADTSHSDCFHIPYQLTCFRNWDGVCSPGGTN